MTIYYKIIFSKYSVTDKTHLHDLQVTFLTVMLPRTFALFFTKMYR